jgi:phage terminase small subunit
MAKLTPKQILFCKEYLVDMNATRAAKAAGYSERTARKIGSENLTKPDIRAQLQKEMKAREFRTDITADRVLNETALVAFSDIQHYMEIGEDGQITAKTWEQIPEHLTRAVESISEDRIIRENPDGTQIIVHDKYKFKLHSKIAALTLLHKNLGLGAEERFRFALEGADGQPIKFVIEYVNTNGTGDDDDKDD